MNVPMMLIVYVRVVMLHHLVPMPMLVPLREVQPYSHAHKRRGNDEER